MGNELLPWFGRSSMNPIIEVRGIISRARIEYGVLSMVISAHGVNFEITAQGDNEDARQVLALRGQRGGVLLLEKEHRMLAPDGTILRLPKLRW